jgi:hypothetical protein
MSGQRLSSVPHDDRIAHDINFITTTYFYVSVSIRSFYALIGTLLPHYFSQCDHALTVHSDAMVWVPVILTVTVGAIEMAGNEG